MNDEQVAEQEALTSIYGDDYESTAATAFSVRVFPLQGEDTMNHVGVRLSVMLLPDYPAAAPPVLSVTVLKGLEDKTLPTLCQLAADAAADNAGMPCVYMVVERLREWLVEHNTAADEGSAYDEMARRDKEKARLAAGGVAAGKVGAAYSKEADPSLAAARGGKVVLSASAEDADEAVRRRKEGTPVTAATFLAWRDRFEREMAATAAAATLAAAPPVSKAGAAAAEAALVLVAARQTGKAQFESGFATATAGDDAAGVGSSEFLDEGTDDGRAPITFAVDAKLFADSGDLPSDEDEDAAEDSDDDEEWAPDGDDDDDDESDEEEEAPAAAAATAKAAAPGKGAGGGGGRR